LGQMGLLRRRCRPPPLPVLNQPSALEDRADDTRAGKAQLGAVHEQPRPQLPRPPGRVLLPSFDNDRFNLRRRSMRNVLRCSRLIEQPYGSELAIPISVLVPRLPADSVLTTKVAHPLAILEAKNKFHPLAHATALFPGHGILLAVPLSAVTLVPGLLCYLCTRSAPRTARLRFRLRLRLRLRFRFRFRFRFQGRIFGGVTFSPRRPRPLSTGG